MSNSDIIKRAECLIEAYREALPLIPSAIYQETGYQLGQVIQGFIPALLQTLAVLGISMVAGAGAGAVIGFFLGGVGVAPGAVVGGQLGLDMGAVILTWLGLAFLVESIGRGLGELVSTLDHAVWIAWIAADRDSTRYYHIDQAAHGLARCVGILFRLILQGIVAMILGKGGVSVSKRIVSSGRALLSDGVEGTANVAVADVVAQLRQSKLPKAFADWVEQNWEDLLRNPKLQTSKAETMGGAAEATKAVSPSQLKQARTGKDSYSDNEMDIEAQAGTSYKIESANPKHKASFGKALTNDYRSTFFDANPDLKGQVVVHHAVEQQVLTKFPGTVSDSEIHSLENLRGIPNELNPDIHLSKIRIEWNRFYKQYIGNGTMPTKTNLLEKATEIDNLYGSQFKPKIGE